MDCALVGLQISVICLVESIDTQPLFVLALTFTRLFLEYRWLPLDCCFFGPRFMFAAFLSTFIYTWLELGLFSFLFLHVFLDFLKPSNSTVLLLLRSGFQYFNSLRFLSLGIVKQ